MYPSLTPCNVLVAKRGFVFDLYLYAQNGLTAVYVASCKGYAQIVELLLRRAADVDLQTVVRLLCVFPD